MRKVNECCWAAARTERSTRHVITRRSASLSRKYRRRMPSMSDRFTLNVYLVYVCDDRTINNRPVYLKDRTTEKTNKITRTPTFLNRRTQSKEAEHVANVNLYLATRVQVTMRSRYSEEYFLYIDIFWLLAKQDVSPCLVTLCECQTKQMPRRS